MAGVRDYEFIGGVETATLPSASTPTTDNDYVNKGYADANYGGPATNISGSMSSPVEIEAASGISPMAGVNSQIMVIQGSGGAVDISADPQIVAGTIPWQQIILVGASDTNTVKLEHGDGLDLNGPITLGLRWSITLIWDAVGEVWMEVARREN